MLHALWFSRRALHLDLPAIGEPVTVGECDVFVCAHPFPEASPIFEGSQWSVPPVEDDVGLRPLRERPDCIAIFDHYGELLEVARDDPAHAVSAQPLPPVVFDCDLDVCAWCFAYTPGLDCDFADECPAVVCDCSGSCECVHDGACLVV